MLRLKKKTNDKKNKEQKKIEVRTHFEKERKEKQNWAKINVIE